MATRCVNIPALGKALAIQLAGILGVPPSSIKLTYSGTEGGGADFNVSVNGSGQIDQINAPYVNHHVSQHYHKGENRQFWYPVPKRSVPGLGHTLHVLWHHSVNSITGKVLNNKMQVHVDIGNPLTRSGRINPWGILVHGGADMTTIAIIAKAEGCAVKFQ